MEKDTMNVVIVGHVDHGKSTLIGRLFFDTDSIPAGVLEHIKESCRKEGRAFEFAYLMDHLEEEREQNITIDTAQKFFKSKKRDYVIIDAPGHVEFIKNMMTGASLAEAAILLVDVNEGLREQTKRHSYILNMLGMNKVIVAINKMDLAGYKEQEYDKVKGDITNFLRNFGITPLAAVPISARDGDNIAKKSDKTGWYNGPAILEALDDMKKTGESKGGSFRFSVQDIYKIDDKRTCVGRIESGTVSEDDEVFIYPSNRSAKIKSIEVFLKDKKKAERGECVGLTTQDELFIERGCVFSKGEKPGLLDKVHASVFWMSREPMKKGDSELILKCATQKIPVTVSRITKRIDSSSLKVLEENAERLNENEVGEVTIDCSRKLIAEDFNKTPELGRFVLVKGNDTVGGGIITHIR